MNNDTTVNVKINATDSTAAVDEARGRFAGLWKQVGGGMIAAQLAQDALQKVKEGIDVVKESAEQWQNQQAAVDAALKSTHDASGLSKQDAIDYAEAVSKGTPVTREAVLAGENMLLTFTNIHKNVMPQTTQAITDMATAMNHGLTPSAGDLTHTAIMVGKALNDPATGLTRLMRVGVAFTQQQKDQIKHLEATGHAAEAQKVMLAELSKEFGGRAAAAGKTFQGRMEMIKNQLVDTAVNALPIAEQKLNSLMNVMGRAEQSKTFQQALHMVERDLKSVWQTIQTGLIPQLQALWKAINPGVTEAFKLWAEVMGVELVVAWKVLIAAIKVFIDAMAIVAMLITDATHFFEAHKVALVGLIGALSAVAAMIIVAVVPAMVSAVIGFGSMAVAAVAAALATMAAWVAAAAPFLAIIAVVALVAMAGYEVVAHWKVVKQWFGDFLNWFKHNWMLVAGIILLPIAPALLAWHMFHNQITGFIKDVISFIKGHWQLLLAILTGPIGAIIIGWIHFHDQIISFIKSAINTIQSVWNSLTGFIGRVISSITNAIRNGVRGFGNLLVNAGHDLINGLIKGIEGTAGKVFDAVKGIGDKAVKSLKGVLKIFSPSAVFADLGTNIGEGLVQGIKGTEISVQQSSANLATAAVVGANSPARGGVINNNSSSYSPSSSTIQNVTIQNLVMPPGSTLKDVLQGINQDAINTGKGLSVVGGAY